MKFKRLITLAIYFVLLPNVIAYQPMTLAQPVGQEQLKTTQDDNDQTNQPRMVQATPFSSSQLNIVKSHLNTNNNVETKSNSQNVESNPVQSTSAQVASNNVLQPIFVNQATKTEQSQVLHSSAQHDQYNVEFPATNNDKAEREQNFAKGLEQIISAATKYSDITTLPAVKTALARASMYVQRYTYVNRGVANDGQAPALILQIQFNKAGISQLLQQITYELDTKNQRTKQPVLVWLVKNTGSNKILENNASNDIAVSVFTKDAQNLNLPILWPALDLTDLNNVKADDICSFDVSKIKEASKRYNTDKILVACINQAASGSNWLGQWLIIDKNSIKNFSNNGITPEHIVMQMLRTLQDDTLHVDVEKPAETRVIMRIIDVKNLGQYNEIIRYVRGFDKVIHVDLAEIGATSVVLSVVVTGNEQVLFKQLTTQDKLIRVDVLSMPNLSTDVDLVYKWNSVSDEQPQANNEQLKTNNIKPQP